MCPARKFDSAKTLPCTLASTYFSCETGKLNVINTLVEVYSRITVETQDATACSNGRDDIRFGTRAETEVESFDVAIDSCFKAWSLLFARLIGAFKMLIESPVMVV